MPVLPSGYDLNLALLGGFDTRLNGVPLAGFTYNKMRALLAYLAVEQKQEHNREFLIELLWHGFVPSAAQNNLRRTLSDLRRALELPSGKTLFSTGKNSIRFIPDIYIDVLDFTRQIPASPKGGDVSQFDQERVIALYRGEFMAGFSLPDCPEFEEWLQVQREALHRRALALLEQLSNHHEQAGDYTKALQFALRYLELEAWDENAHRRVMRLYALSGQDSAAIAQFKTCCRLLKQELGALPGEATRELARQIGDGQFGVADTAVARYAGLKPAPQSASQLPAERRQITALYCELSAATDDPDEAMELLHAPQARCVEIIRQFSGHIVQTHGGGLLAYFGYPQAHEDAARRAMQAALALTHAVHQGIEIRAGVHTGIIISSGDASMPDTVGKTSRLAIKLRQHAAPGEVTISRDTHYLVSGYFNCLSLGLQALFGFAQPLEIFKVLASSGALTRLDAAAQLTPLTGRSAEVTKLLELWDEAAQGKRNVVLIQGEAGIGKSRILHTLKERLADKSHALRELRCFPEFSQSPFYPIIALLEPFYNFAHSDTPAMKSSKLGQHMATHYPTLAADTVPLLLDLFSLPHEELQPAFALTPKKHKERTVAILLDMLQALAIRQPVLFVVEDLHWADPSTLELLSLFVSEKRSGTILTLFTARPEFDPPWDETLETTMTLAPLADEEVAKIITSLNADIPTETARHIVARADGVPLFVEEMTKMASLHHQIGIPSTLHDLLATRIDNLGETKRAAQLASAIGRQFDLDLLRKVSPDNPAEFARSISILEDAGLILQTSKTSRQFKHALIQETAYQSQTKADRQTAHISIARALQTDFPDIVNNHPEVIAQHFNAGGEARQAIEYWLCAAERTALYSAFTEELGHLQSGLDALGSLPDAHEKDRLEFALQLRYGFAMQTRQGYGANTTVQAFYKAIELAKKIGNIPGLFQAQHGLNAGLSSHPDFNNTSGLAIARQLLGIAQESGDPYLLQQAYYSLGSATFWMGDFTASRLHHEQSIALDPPNPQDIRLDYTNQICSVSNQSFLSWILWFQGFPEQAQHISQLSVARARQVASPRTLMFALTYAATLQGRLKNIDASLALAEECILLGQKTELPIFILSSMLRQGWGQALQGKTEGLTQIKTCIERMRKAMGGIIVAFHAVFAEALLYHGQAEEALSVVNESLAECEKKNDHHIEAELHRLKGEALMQLARPDEAEICFERALQISRDQGAKSLELRAASSIARLWRQQGKPADAKRVLEEIYSWFTEGFDTPDLQEAANLLSTMD